MILFTGGSLCLGNWVSVGVGVCPVGLSVQGGLTGQTPTPTETQFPGQRLPPVNRITDMVSVQGRVSVKGVSVHRGLCQGGSRSGGLCQGDPYMEMSEQYASHCNAFLSQMESVSTLILKILYQYLVPLKNHLLLRLMSIHDHNIVSP